MRQHLTVVVTTAPTGAGEIAIGDLASGEAYSVDLRMTMSLGGREISVEATNIVGAYDSVRGTFFMLPNHVHTLMDCLQSQGLGEEAAFLLLSRVCHLIAANVAIDLAALTK